MFVEEPAKVPPLHVLKREVRAAVVVADLVNLNDMRMPQPCHSPGLELETGQGAGTGQCRGGTRLQSHQAGKTELSVYMPSTGSFAYRPANGGQDVHELSLREI